MNLPTPIAIEGESPQALAAFKSYVAMGRKRSIRAVARRLHKSSTLCGRWSRRNKWVERLRDLETAAALQANEAQAQAGAEAKRKFAEEIEREELRFIQRTIAASEKATAKALEILEQPIGDSKPTEAARLFAVGHSIGSAALNLPNANLSAQGFASNAPVINVVLSYDETSHRVDEITKEYLEQHSDHPQAARFLAEFAEREREWLARNGHSDGSGE